MWVVTDTTNYGTVTGRVLRIIADSVDAGDDPDGVPAVGKVVFTPGWELAQNSNLGILIPEKIECPLDVNGDLTSPGNPAQKFVKLFPNDDPLTQPLGATWLVQIVLTTPSKTLTAFSITVLSGQTIDLKNVIPVAASAGTTVSAATAAALASAASSADSAASAAAAEAAAGSAGNWSTLAGKPSTFPPTIGATSVTAVAGNDARLTDQRVPVDASVTNAKVATGISADKMVDGGTNHVFTAADDTKLTGISANAVDAAAVVAAIAAAAGVSVASLVGGVIPTAQIPSIALVETFPVASQAAMLALTAQRGDVALRSDNSTAYMLSSNSPSTLADWKVLGAPGLVTSVNGQQGVIVLAKADIGLGSVDNTSNATERAATATLTGKTMSGSANIFTNIPGTAVVNTPAGGIAAVTTQAAINELDAEKAPKANPDFTGGTHVSVPAATASSDAVPLSRLTSELDALFPNRATNVVRIMGSTTTIPTGGTDGDFWLVKTP